MVLTSWIGKQVDFKVFKRFDVMGFQIIQEKEDKLNILRMEVHISFVLIFIEDGMFLMIIQLFYHMFLRTDCLRIVNINHWQIIQMVLCHSQLQIISLHQYWMISSLWPQMFNLQPTFYWIPNLTYCGSFEPNMDDQPQTPVLEQLTSTSKSKDGEIDEHLKEPKRRTWTVDEDEKLLALIKTMNFSEGKRLPYHKIAKHFIGRTSKQIRQRYLNHLNSSIRKDPFSEIQDKSILSYYTENGPKWKKLSLIMKGRTPTALKNRFNTKLKQTLTKCSISCQQSEQILQKSSKLFQSNVRSSTDNYTSQDSF